MKAVPNVLGFIVAATLALTAVAVSFIFRHPYYYPKYLVLAFGLLAMAIYIGVARLPLAVPASLRIRISVGIIFLAIVISTGLSAIGERYSAVGFIALWVGLVLSFGTILKRVSLRDFLSSLSFYSLFFSPFIIFMLINNELYELSKVRPFMGNPNQAGNFVAIAALLAIFGARQAQSRLTRASQVALAIMGVLLLVLLKARGALLGFSIATLVMHWSHLQKFVSRPRLICSLLIVAGGVGLVFAQKGSSTLMRRVDYWIDTLCLVRDFPLGVGPGAFVYVFERYSGTCSRSTDMLETVQIHNPHNMFVEFMAEIGIVGGLAILFLIFAVLRALRSDGRDRTCRTWVYSFGSLLAIIGFFEFPQDAAVTAYFMALICGVAIAQIRESNTFGMLPLRFLNLLIALAVVSLLSVKAYADVRYRTNDPISLKERACRLDPENWRTCAALAEAYLREGQLDEAERVIDRMAERFENYHIMFDLRARLALQKNDWPTVCLEYRKLIERFQGQSAKVKFVTERCAGL